MDIYGLSLRGSGVSETPHEVRGCIKFLLDKQAKISSMKCSCPAGESGRCKHVAGILLYCSRWYFKKSRIYINNFKLIINFRNDICSLDLLSQTDVKCTWKIKKGPSLAQYQPKPLLETACFKEGQEKIKRPQVSAELKNYFIRTLLDACPNSAIACHR